MRVLHRWLVLWILVSAAGLVWAEPVHHAIQVRLDPGGRALEVEDRVRLPADAARNQTLGLHAGLQPRVVAGAARLAPLGDTEAGAGVPLATYRLELDAGVREVTLAYAGEINHPVAELGAAYARSFSVSPGIIGADGVFLGGSSYWLPAFADHPFLTFRMQLSLPEGWRAVSQGERLERADAAGQVTEVWAEAQPQEEVYLVAAPFTEYQRSGAVADAQVFLREPDPALAEGYLALTERYLAMYDALLGDYPYAKFALVENFWETGYGMPSFTLLGPRVVRMPFIAYTSYPHEILHNWWGNGVYVDFAGGNWSEGLTSYLADHLLQEQRGAGADYRRAALQKYADYVGTNADFALTQFRGRHNAVTEAVGYGKTLMLFHMLRQELGDAAFTAGLRRFYADNRFRVAGWPEVAAAFGAVSGAPLDDFFAQWVRRPGALQLGVRDVAVEQVGEGYRVRGVLEQTQAGPVYRVQVPVALMREGQAQAHAERIALTERAQPFVLNLPSRPLSLAVDPAYDLFRRLYREEIPPAISQAMGAEEVLILVPADAPKPLRDAYRALAETWASGHAARVSIRLDESLDSLPDDRAVWLLGWENRFRPLLAEALSGYPVTLAAEQVSLAGQTLTRDANSLVLLARHPGNPEQALGWLASDTPAALPGLARKLPHYGKYSYLGFSGNAPDNTLKGQWPAQQSPLTLSLTDQPAPPLVLRPSAPLVELPPEG